MRAASPRYVVRVRPFTGQLVRRDDELLLGRRRSPRKTTPDGDVAGVARAAYQTSLSP